MPSELHITFTVVNADDQSTYVTSEKRTESFPLKLFCTFFYLSYFIMAYLQSSKNNSLYINRYKTTLEISALQIQHFLGFVGLW